MSEFLNQSRRKFLLTAGASAVGSIFLKGCLGNPPGTTGSVTQVKQVAATNINPAQAPETPRIKLGYVPIVESAPLIIALEKGFFAKHGMTEVELSKQASWGSARDNVEIGAAGGGIDGGQWQMPMPHLISEGIITKGNVKIPMYLLMQLITHGNGIAVASKWEGKGINLKLAQGETIISQLKSSNNIFKAAHTFPHVNQDFWIRYWLAAGGINPDADINLMPVPSAQTVANMKTGTMDAFSTGDPWPYRIVKDKIGYMAALTAEIWKNHPEEYLAIRADWVDKNPKATKALLKGIMEAQQWLDNFDNREEAANILAGRNYFNLPVEILTEPFQGKYNMGDGRTIDDRSMAALYWKDEKGSVSYPYKSHDLWFLTESVRWGFLPPDTLTNATAIIDKVNREDLWKEAAQELGVAAADIPTSTSRGVEEFFDGIRFDPANPTAYLQSLKVKRVNI
ncbi:CmpA/NrtA family ABC transporter substrate-binding protein [Gloeocapsopsis dulcis]|uniref:Bicarbonate-binding protein n=1 Tax=Gloeocapsopsis dulcis AAB1 = 1H9 TaxID=1433147 RepID=A0A6N8FV34_9CHRO|nr:CmpA/NrtA family ABC transporter substrate-binding protein [Gloeocapsopsis dulcis]MUL36185.1 bicarbonate-binding protein [Gloeocapsopsis dulcis AAB1 = 1H9]WNN91339.1 CmpA/NrtA family ABC transporter substrate-binding protein [Gloeocapsopsis dulcis]